MKSRSSSKEEIVKLVQEKDIKIINLCHIPEDGHLKTLSFVARERLCEILEFGERVDGSSLFSYLDPKESDVYIMPKPETAFVNPFSSVSTLNILCKYVDQNGQPLDIAPGNILSRAEKKLFSSTGIILKALAELEFYVIYEQGENIFPGIAERNYHESLPFAKSENIRNEVLATLENIGVATKYGHAEVGRVETKTGHIMEQHEIELLPQNLSKMAETVPVMKWIVRNVCAKYGVSVSFSPKPALEHAGNGMHIHICGLKENKNIIADSEGNLTGEAKQMIGGILKFAPSLTAFGNTISVSYLRFISRKESPMHICWGTRNRLALIRIPLWWKFRKDFEKAQSYLRTFEYRGPDPSANTYLLLAGVAAAVEYGLKNPEEALTIAEDLSLDRASKRKGEYEVLPLSCSESARTLNRDRSYYEADGVFPETVIDGTIRKLESYKDKDLRKNLTGKPKEIEKLLVQYLHYG